MPADYFMLVLRFHERRLIHAHEAELATLLGRARASAAIANFSASELAWFRSPLAI